jgi:flagellar biosynthesis protein FlhA
MAGCVMLLLSLIPGLPKLSFVLMAGVMVFLARRVKAEEAVAAAASAAEGKKPAAGAVPAGDPLDNLLKLDELTLEVGYGLVRLVDVKQGGHLLAKVKSLRKHLATQLGFLAPPIHITDNISLKENEYVVYLRGVEIARWQMRRDCLLAINSNPNAPALAGTETREPAFNVAAKWIAADLQAQALSMGYTVVDQTSVLATHLGELVKQNAHELLTRQETKRMLDHIGESHPKLLDELVPKLLTLGEVQRVLQQLLREQVSIRDLGTILETLAETAPMTKNPVLLVEAVRHSLGRALVHPLLSEQGDLKVVTVAASIEEECNRAINPQQNVLMPSVMPTNTARHILESLRKLFGDQLLTAPPVLLCSSPGRFYLRRLLEPFLPRIVVLAPTEIPPVTPVQSIGALQ